MDPPGEIGVVGFPSWKSRGPEQEPAQAVKPSYLREDQVYSRCMFQHQAVVGVTWVPRVTVGHLKLHGAALPRVNRLTVRRPSRVEARRSTGSGRRSFRRWNNRPVPSPKWQPEGRPVRYLFAIFVDLFAFIHGTVGKFSAAWGEPRGPVAGTRARCDSVPLRTSHCVHLCGLHPGSTWGPAHRADRANHRTG
jgi:hypothetical protein